jgi:hypothetical protein
MESQQKIIDEKLEEIKRKMGSFSKRANELRPERDAIAEIKNKFNVAKK